MKPNTDELSRRNFLKWGGGFLSLVAGTFVSASGLAKVMDKVTPPHPLGPFFPDEGDEAHVIRENPDFSVPISMANDNDLTFVKGRKGKARGQVVYLRGRVLGLTEGQPTPLPGAVIILWSADESGRYNHRGDAENTKFSHPRTGKMIARKHDANFQYWGRSLSDKNGDYWFKTVVPGFYPADLRNRWYRPPHLHIMILAPGYPQRVTQLYFKGDQIQEIDFIQELNAKDFLLRNPRIPTEDQESLIIEYKKDLLGKIDDGLVGDYNFVIPA
ncbi:MAG: hypothetical protein NPINA01_23540 [Nitrospinaceae bacterium]|nr:MAG: hypothetical protein NPINA01_23540 [Nitrospinaceae bacterium]